MMRGVIIVIEASVYSLILAMHGSGVSNTERRNTISRLIRSGDFKPYIGFYKEMRELGINLHPTYCPEDH